MNTLPKEFTVEQAVEYVNYEVKKTTTFYNNVYGWNTYLTLEPTFATPTGKLKGFPRSYKIKYNKQSKK